MRGLETVVDALQAAFPHGVSGEQYLAVLYVLTGDMSDAGIDDAMAEAFGMEHVVVDNDVAAVLANPPTSRAVESARRALENVGWSPDPLP